MRLLFILSNNPQALFLGCLIIFYFLCTNLKNMIRKSLLLLALLLASWIVSAQSYLFKHLEVSDGLSNNSVNTIYKDRDGFMWFGTTTGLNRYDGYTFKITG